jgi:hypothetical protein
VRNNRERQVISRGHPNFNNRGGFSRSQTAVTGSLRIADRAYPYRQTDRKSDGAEQKAAGEIPLHGDLRSVRIFGFKVGWLLARRIESSILSLAQ